MPILMVGGVGNVVSCTVFIRCLCDRLQSGSYLGILEVGILPKTVYHGLPNWTKRIRQLKRKRRKKPIQTWNQDHIQRPEFVTLSGCQTHRLHRLSRGVCPPKFAQPRLCYPRPLSNPTNPETKPLKFYGVDNIAAVENPSRFFHQGCNLNPVHRISIVCGSSI